MTAELILDPAVQRALGLPTVEAVTAAPAQPAIEAGPAPADEPVKPTTSQSPWTTQPPACRVCNGAGDACDAHRRAGRGRCCAHCDHGREPT